MRTEFFKHPKYTGVSNQQGLGSIFDKKDGLTFRNAVVKELIDKITAYGKNGGSCNEVESINTSLEALLNFTFINTAQGKVNGYIQRAKEISGGITGWKIDEIGPDEFRAALNEEIQSTPHKLDAYIESLKNNFLMNKVVWATGFKSKVILSDSIDIGLAASMDSDKVVANISDANVTLHFQRRGRDTLLITTADTFAVFGNFVKVKFK